MTRIALRKTGLGPFLAFFAMALAFYLALSWRFSQFAVSELSRFNQGMADSTAANVDLLVERLKGFAQIRLEDPGLQAWLDSSASDAVADYEAEWGLMRAFSAEPYVSGALLLAPDSGYLLDTRTRRWDWAAFPDRELLEKVQKPSPYLHMVGGPDWLALPLPSSFGLQSGVAKARVRRSLVILANKGLVEKYVLQSETTGALRAFVLDSRGRLILGLPPGVPPSVSPNVSSGPISGQGADWLSLLGGERTRRVTIGSQSWLLCSRQLQREDWTLVRAVRLEELGEKAFSFQALLVAAIAALVLLYWAGLKWSEARLARPFRRMEAERRELARQEALRAFLGSGALEPNEEALLRLDLGFEPRSPFCLSAARIESYKSWREDSGPEEQRRLRRAALASWESRARERGLAAAGVDMAGDTLFLLVQDRGSLPTPSAIDELLLDGEPSLPEGLPPMAYASIEVSPGRDQMRYAAESLRELSFLKYISGDARVYREVDMARTLDRQPVRPVQDEAELLAQAVRSSDDGELDRALSELREGMRELPYVECKLRLVMICFLLFREFGALMGQEEGFLGLERSLGSFDSLELALSWIRDRLAPVQARLAAPTDKESRRLEIVRAAEAYALDQLSDFTLNIERVAAQVELSPGYLRQVFKEVRGQTLSDFIHERRIARIKEQLEQSDLPVSRLIERSGFQTKSHFFTAFKEATGLTPDQYRRSKRR